MPQPSPVCNGPLNGYHKPSAHSGYHRSCAHWQHIPATKKQQQRDSLARWQDAWRSKEVVPEIATDWQRVAGDQKDVTPFITSTLTPRERQIVELDATALLEHLHHPDLYSEDCYTSAEVTKAFCKSATVANALTNCLTEIFFDVAMTRATELDQYRLENDGRVVGPLHGLPVSIKDHIFVKGLDTSTGYVAWANKSKATEDAVAVHLLRRAGAVLYAKTANPQTLLVGNLCLTALMKAKFD
jgi:amidase